MSRHMDPELMQRIHDEMVKGTPRYLRARRFSDQVRSMLRDFLPRDRDCQDMIDEVLMEIGFTNNAEIISVPPEKDHLDKLQLERAMVERHPVFIEAEKLSPLKKD